MKIAESRKRLGVWAVQLKCNIRALWVAAGGVRTPSSAKIVAALVAAYALSPIDLVPDFIPIIGLLDDLILLPLGIMLALRLIPRPLMARYRHVAARSVDRNRSLWGAAIIASLWALCLILLIRLWLG